MTRYICSKMFTDLNIKFPDEIIKNCCKSNDDKIKLDDLQNNFLVNNAEYQKRKSSMLYDNALPVNGCDTCVRTEPNSLFRSWNEWRNKDTYTNDEVNSLYKNENFNYYEFVMSSDCDLKCVYCGAKDSSSWAKELGERKRAASKQWKDRVEEEIIHHLENKKFKDNRTYFFSFSGGEPTYNVEMIDYMQKIIKLIPAERSVINISTNLNAKEKIFTRFLNLIDDNNNLLFTVDSSFEDIGKRCEAIRSGLNWDRAMKNMDKLFLRDNVQVRISPTPNLYSIPNVLEFLKYFVEKFKANNKFKPEGNDPTSKNNLLSFHSMFNHNMVQEPPLTPMSLPMHYKKYLTEAIEYCYNNDLTNYASHLERIKELIGSKIDSNTSKRIEQKFGYFKKVRPEYDWDALFPHVQEVIDETKNHD